MGRLFLTVAVPYQALADQWISELKKFRVAPILCSSANPGWDNELALKIDRFQAGKTTFGAAVVVNATLSSSRFQQVILRLRDSGVFLFVGDECHHHGTQRLFSSLPDNADLRLGLSATYERFEDQEGTKRLEQYYGNVVDNFTLGDAMDAGFLVPYEYHLEPVQLNVSETAEYVLISDKIRDRLRSLGSTEPEALLEDDIIRSLLFRRARLLGRLEAKQKKLIDILASRGVTSRTLVYCGEGSSPDGVEDSLSYEELQNIDVITREISRMGYRVSKFTSREPPDIRRSTLEGFRRGAIQILTAIRCLDEGIDVPSCETAFILASSRNPRQFIQRRGRVLRRSAGKSRAVLWDFLPLPPQHQNDEKHEEAILKRELSRISEFSRHSLNFRETYDKLQGLLERYDLGAEFVLGES